MSDKRLDPRLHGLEEPNQAGLDAAENFLIWFERMDRPRNSVAEVWLEEAFTRHRIAAERSTARRCAEICHEHAFDVCYDVADAIEEEFGVKE